MPDLTESKIYQDTVRINDETKAKLQDRIRDLKNKFSDAETVRAELLVKYTPEYPKVKTVQAQIEKLKENKQKAEREIATSIEAGQKKLEREAISGALITLRSQLEAAIKREAQSRKT